MPVLIATVDDPKAIQSCYAALATILPADSIKVLEEQPPPSPSEASNSALKQLAKEVATLIAPKPSQAMRHDALRMALIGGDTFYDQEGEPDPAFRNALGALSKAMRPLFKLDSSPIDRIAVRKKHFDKDGIYLGTRYHPTELGRAVREILSEQGHLPPVQKTTK